MSHVEIDKTLQMMVDNCAELLEGHGYEIVTEDKTLFPFFVPSLAGLREGRLLIFGIGVSQPGADFWQELSDLQEILRRSTEENTPESDSRVHLVEKIALILSPQSIEGITPAGDVHWIGLGNPGELADKVRGSLSL